MANSLPTLSMDGNVSDPILKADRLLAYFFTSDAHQSNSFQGSIASLPYIIKECANNPQEVASMATSVLNNLFDSYYDSVNCDIETDNIVSANGKLSVNLIVKLSFTQANQSYNLARIAEVIDSKLSRVAEVI